MASPVQRRIVLTLVLLVAGSRLLPIAASPFDWDEAQFALGVEEYDVGAHHPHPPGYPAFIAAAKLFHILGLDPFRSLQAVVVLAALCLFPALLLLARNLGFDFTTAAGGALLYVLLPNTWIYGGTGFSDIPAAALCFAGTGLLLVERPSRRQLFGGALALGLAAAIRPTSLLVGAGPLLVAAARQFRARQRRSAIFALVVAGGVVLGSYAAGALASSGVSRFASSVEHQADYLARVDSFRNPARPPLREVARTFLVEPFDSPLLGGSILILALLSLAAALVRRREEVLLTVALFAPLAVLSWLTLDVGAAGRYALAYLPLHALLAADGVRILGRRVAIRVALTGLLCAYSLLWTWPAALRQRLEPSPPAAACAWIRDHAPPGAPLYVDEALRPLSQYLLPDHPLEFFTSASNVTAIAPGTWMIEARPHETGENFHWPEDRLWRILRRRNFRISVHRLDEGVRFGAGWHDEERAGNTIFRWMSSEATAFLPSFGGPGRLRLVFYVPLDSIPPPTVDVYLNRELVESRVATVPNLHFDVTAVSRGSGPDELRVVTSATVRPADLGTSNDTRELGLRLNSITWSPER